jgi:hypothetical protein
LVAVSVSVNKTLRIGITRDIWKSHRRTEAQIAKCAAADRNEFKNIQKNLELARYIDCQTANENNG